MLRWNENGNFMRRCIFGVNAPGDVVVLFQYREEGGIVVTGYDQKVHYIFDKGCLGSFLIGSSNGVVTASTSRG